jgi:hypothetical protein
MSQFFKALLPLKPTKSGLNFIKTETFMQLCQRVAHTMLTSGKGWDDVDAALRHITVKELLPKRDYDENEVAEFYSRNWRLIDSAWLSAVQLLKEATVKMAADPVKFLREKGMIPPTQPGMPSAATLGRHIDGYSPKSTSEKPLRGTIPVPTSWKEGEDYV